jgi:hypothetical protein
MRNTEESKVASVALELSPSEYGEVLAKLANELDSYSHPDGSSDATDDLKRAFAKLDAACPYAESEFFQTTLMRKFRIQLAEFYPVRQLPQEDL